MQHGHLPLANLKRSSVYVWNLMIRNSANNGFFTHSLNTYSLMLRSGLHGNNFTFPLLFKACASLNSIWDGKILHSHVLHLGFQAHPFVQTALIDMYSKCSRLSSSIKVFDEMHTSIRTSVSWNSMLSAYCRASFINQAILLLKQMWILGLELTASTFLGIVSGCTLKQGLSMHCFVLKLGLINSETPLANSVMSMYAKYGCVKEARLIFDEMDDDTCSIISWTTIIGGYVNIGNVAEAFAMFNQMRRQRGVTPDFVVFVNLISGCIHTGNLLLAASVHSLLLKSGCNDENPIDNLLISMYAKCGDLESARRVFDMVHAKGVFLWTSMIAGYTQSGYPTEAFDLFKRLLRTSIRPNEATLATILSACADLGSLGMGKEIEEYILLQGLGCNRQVQTSLIHMFSKCGSIERAKEVFDTVTNKDLAVWSAMIYGYAIHGMGHEALSLFRKMQHVPDAVVYTSVLLACSHSGLVEDGLMYFESMKNEVGIEPSLEHYTCLVDILGRAGCFDLALRTINGMPVQVQPKVWAPLLSACRKHRNIELGEFAATKMLTLNPQSSGNYVSMANLYTSDGKWKEAAKARRLMNDKGLVKEPGWSQVEIDGSMHVFVAGDRSVDIYNKLDELNVKLLDAETLSFENHLHL
ncbi:hypothetical protein EZV62_024318 [Acer yangbiense]|uniref:DYW domain-containing protein n=1 Tax=Acer yangbiense TaxID=1000413 RepID=A0A5C7H459_9ROSI|nr:hypothetical protein EZV62_024318 [Acer yangbiense]